MALGAYPGRSLVSKAKAHCHTNQLMNYGIGLYVYILINLPYK